MVANGIVVYHATQAPYEGIRVLTERHGLDEGSTEMKAVLKPEQLMLLRATDRRRRPDQNVVMGESAKQHAERLIQAGRVIVPTASCVSWHWCHLIGFSLLPVHRAQNQRNLICGSAAANGQMDSLEEALRKYVVEGHRTVRVEVNVSHWLETRFGLRLKYFVFDPNTTGTFTQYFDLYSQQKTDTSESLVLYERMRRDLLEVHSSRKEWRNDHLLRRYRRIPDFRKISRRFGC